MTESSWQRLYRLTEERRSEKGLTRNNLRSLGGPSSETMRKLATRTDPPSLRQREALDSIDRVLGWPAGTSWRIARGVTDDEMTADYLADEDDRLVHMADEADEGDEIVALPVHEQLIRDFGTSVTRRLRTLPEDEAEALMTRLGRDLGIWQSPQPNG